MLIRSQNKEDLMQLDDISVCQRGDFPDICSNFAVVCYRQGTHCVLGEYSTKEKAIKVLDNIEERYLQYGTIRDGRGNIYNAVIVPKFFQMPQDDEV